MSPSRPPQSGPVWPDPVDPHVAHEDSAGAAPRETPTTPALVARAQRGDLDAFESIVRSFQHMACAYAYGMVGDFHLAQDVAQEAFLEAFFALPDLREPAAFPGWFRRIVLKHADRLTRGKRLATVALERGEGVVAESAGLSKPADLADPADAIVVAERDAQIRRAVLALPERERVATMLFYVAGASYAEVAAALDVPLSTVKKRLHDARRRLKAPLGDLLPTRSVPGWPVGMRPPPRFSATIDLYLAVRTGDTRRVQQLLRGDPGLANVRVARASREEIATMQWFAPPNHGDAPLHWAVRGGDARMVEVLLDHGADIEASNRHGETPLLAAALPDGREIARRLLVRGADPNATANAGLTALHRAAMRGLTAMAELLLAHGASVNPRDAGGRTPLAWAVRNAHVASAAALRRHGGL